MAPTIVGESIKGAFLLAEVFGATFGLPTNPPSPLSPPPPPPAGGTVAPNGGAGAETEAAAAAAAVEAGGRGGGVGGRTDIVQALELGDRDRLIKFCEAVQLFSPVNAYVRPGELLPYTTCDPDIGFRVPWPPLLSESVRKSSDCGEKYS